MSIVKRTHCVMTPELRADMRRCAESMRVRNQICFAGSNLDEYSTALRVLAYLDAEDAAPDFTHVADGYVEADAMDSGDDIDVWEHAYTAQAGSY